MAAYAKYLPAIGPLFKAIQVATDTWKIALAAAFTNTDSAFTAGTTDLATGGGYTQGGATVSVTSSTVTAGTLNLILASPSTWTASGGGFTFRYVLLINSTNNIPVGSWDYGSNVVMNGSNADTFAATLDATNGVFSAA